MPSEIARGRVMRRLADGPAGGARLVLVSAPAGYGKTVALAQWARGAGMPVAWVAVRHEHRDPRSLLGDVAEALRVAAADPAPGRTAAPASPAAVRLAVAGIGRPFLLVLDGAEALGSPEALAAVSALIAELPAGARVALSCRSDPDLQLGRRLVEGDLVRVTRDVLAFHEGEARELLGGSASGLTPEALAGLLRRTEGWPAALRIAALRLAGQADPSAAAAAFAGDDRWVAGYLRETMLDGLPPGTLTFLRRTSVLDRLSPGACDAVTGSSGSAAVLLGLERAGVPLVPLDTRGELFRHHRLLRDMLRGELRRREPELVPVLHGRAGAWLEAAGDAAAAVRHSLAAGDVERAVGLTWSSFAGDLTRGRIDRLRSTLAALGVDRMAASAPLALASAWCCAETRGDLAMHWLSQAGRAAAAGAAGDADAVDAGATTLRALLAPEGLAQMARDAARGFRAASDLGPWRAYCRFVEGAAHHLGGEHARARALLEDGVERAGSVAPSVHALCLAQLALLLLDHDEPVRGLMLARRSRAVVEEWGLGSYASAALPYAVCALAFAESGHAGEARDGLREARRVLDGTSDAAAWFAVEVRVAVARAALASGEEQAAREALTEAQRLVGRLEDTPLLRDEVERLSRRVQPVPEGDAACLSSISAAEARVLRLLPTHHSFREIGELLFLSRFTVKSHAHSLYRKLGVSSRSEAVERARQLRILGAPPA